MAKPLLGAYFITITWYNISFLSIFFITVFRGRTELDYLGSHDLCLQELPAEF